MVSFALIISFLLHVIALASIYTLFQQLQNLKKQDSQEIMELMETYLQEVKDENSRLQQEFQTMKQIEQANAQVKMVASEKDLSVTDSQPEELREVILPENDAGDTIEASLESRVLQLYHSGVSANDIARKIGCGKTEVEIIIKLHEKNNRKA